MFSTLVIVGCMVFIQGNNLILRNNQDPVTLSEHVKANLEQDSLAVEFLTKVWSQAPNESFADLLHLVFSHAYISSQVFASEVKNGDLSLRLIRDPDVYQTEYMNIMSHDQTTKHRFKTNLI